MTEATEKKTMRMRWTEWVWLRALVVGGGMGLILGLVTYLLAPGLFQGFEAGLFDMRVRFANEVLDPPDQDTGIFIIAIDNRSLQQYGPFRQWPRERHGQLASMLADAGASAIFFDLLIAEEDKDPEVDRRLARQLGDAGIVYTAASLTDRSSFYFASQARDDPVLQNAPRSAFPLERFPGAEAFPDQKATKVLEGPPDPITRACLAVGLVNVVGDEDGVIRRQPLFFRHGDVLFPTVALRMYLDLTGTNLEDLTLEPARALRAGELEIPVDAQGRYLMKWYPPDQGPFRVLPYYDVLEGRVPMELFEGAVCFVGPTAPGLYDTKATPASRATPGVFIHATLLTNLAMGHTVRRMGEGLGILSVVVLSVLAAWLALRFRLSSGVIALVILFLAGISFAFMAYTQWTYWVEFFRPALGLVFGYTGAMAYRYATEERQKRVVKGAFQQYVSRDVVDEMLLNPDKLKLGGERKELTILFADIQGFTSFSEQLAPEELTQFLNRFLTLMTRVIFEFHGTVDKYIGDAIMAIFGAPLPREEHALEGVRAAVGMRRALVEFIETHKAELPETFDLKLGLNTGPMVVGNMGSDVRFDYTVLGDNVNLAARLEALTRQYGASLLISEATREAIGEEAFAMRELDRVRVKGKQNPVSIYEVLAETGSAEDTPEVRGRIEAFADALEKYRAMAWDEARAGFERLEGDPAASVFAERCRLLAEDPPDADWDGVWVMKTK